VLAVIASVKLLPWNPWMSSRRKRRQIGTRPTTRLRLRSAQRRTRN